MPSKSQTDKDNQVPVSDGEEPFSDAQGTSHQIDHEGIKELVKRKNAYAKKRLTMAENLLTTTERKATSTLRQTDVDLATQYLDIAHKAIQAVNTVIETSNHLLHSDELDTYLNMVEEHMPRHLDIVTRVNLIEDHVKSHSNPVVPSTHSSNHAITTQSMLKKIDKTFRPDPLDEDATPATFHRWRDEFNIYVERNALDQAPLHVQRLILNKCLTPAMAKTLASVCLAEATSTIPQIMKLLEKFILEANNLFTRRYNFLKCVQLPNETYQQYLVGFREIGDHAGFETFTYEDMMALRIVTGVHDQALRRELLRLPKQDFTSIHKFATAWQSSNANADNIMPADSEKEINKLSTYKSEKKKAFHKNFQSSMSSNNKPAQSQQTKRQPSQSSRDQSKSCGYCGLTVHHPGGCQVRSQQCSHCGLFGHFARVCRKRLAGQPPKDQARPIRSVEETHLDSQHEDQLDQCFTEEDDNTVSTIFSLHSHDQVQIAEIKDSVVSSRTKPTRSKPTPKFHLSFYMFDQLLGTAWALPDTGASVSVLPFHLAQAWNILDKVSTENAPLTSANGSNCNCYGTIQLSVLVQHVKITIFFFVCTDVKNVLISWHVLHDLGIISQKFPRIAALRTSSQVSTPTLHFNNLKLKIVKQFSTVFRTSKKLHCMKGPLMRIHLNNSIDWNNIKQIYRPRPIPVPLREATKRELDTMINNGIIKPVDQPTQFTSPLLVVPKKQGKVRLVVDYTQLNRHVRRPVHPFPSVAEVRTMIPNSATYFATFDALQGYWQLPLHTDSQLLTTFITPWGRFCYTRAPMGLSSSGDEFCRRGDLAFKNISGVIKVVDDLLIYASTVEQLETTIYNVMEAAQKVGITLSAEKFKIGTSISFLGMQISNRGVSPDPKHTSAISEFPPPKNKTDLRSFLGLVNQFTTFSKSISSLAKTLRPLLSTETLWHWSKDHDLAFKNLKQLLLQAPILKFFDPALPTKLVTDASKLNGLGFALLQKHGEGWALIACGSRFITHTESNYAICELEALAIAWAIMKCRIYLMGLQHFDVITDHKPLVSIFNSSRLIQTENPRLVRIMQRVTAYNFKVYWTPGKQHAIPDALSRAPVTLAALDDDLVTSDGSIFSNTKDPALQDIILQAKSCPQYSEFRKVLSSSTSEQIKKLPSSSHGYIKAYASIWDRLSIDDSGLILLDNIKIFVPSTYRKILLNLAHASHQGISRTKARLQDLYFWQGMSNEVVQLLQSCEQCQTFRQSQPDQPISPHPVPAAPFRSVSCDLFDYKGSFTLVFIDRFSSWPLVAHFNKSPSSGLLIKTISTFIKDFGIPETLRHDGARPFISAEFKAFLKEHNITSQLSSAYNPRSNGHAEACVKTIKSLVKKYWKARQLDELGFNNALLEFRNTPRHPANLSPAELLFGRKLRTLLPALQYKTVPHHIISKAVQTNYDFITKAYRAFNSRRTYLRPLAIGDQVRIQDPITRLWDKTGTIKEIRPRGLSYYVLCQGKIYLRNRKFLKKKYSNS